MNEVGIVMKNTTIFAILLLAVVMLSGCTQQSPASSSPEKVFSLEEVAQHNTAADCWMAINGNVYNLAEFLSSSPNAQEMAANCGKESASPFGSRQFPQDGRRPDANSMQRPDANRMNRDFNGVRSDANTMRSDSFRQRSSGQMPSAGNEDFLSRFYLGKLKS